MHVQVAKSILHVLVFVTREACWLLACWLRWASVWLITDDALDYRLQLHVHTPFNITSTSSFAKSERWHAVLRDRLEFVREAVERLPVGSTILFTDLDVIPFRAPSALLPLRHDLVFMREPPGHGGKAGRHIVNSGLFAIRVTKDTRKFVGLWAYWTRRYPRLMDQDVANWMLLAKPGDRMHFLDVDWGTWPRSIASGLLDDISNATVAFHAIFTTGREKADRIAEAFNRMRLIGGHLQQEQLVGSLSACESNPSSCAASLAAQYAPPPPPTASLRTRRHGSRLTSYE
jgi:hypothetical protein